MSEIPGHLYVAIGAVVAIIAGIFSYFNLVTSKETKISEFRQNWIDSLRQDISKYVSSMQSLISFEDYINHHLDENEKLKTLKRRADLHDIFFDAYNSIHLRINKNETNAKAKEISDNFISALENAHKAFKAEREDLEYLLEQVKSNAELLLKHEWNRVRDGEKTYQYAKKGALIFTSITIVIFILLTIFIATPGNIVKQLPSPTNNINKQLSNHQKIF